MELKRGNRNIRDVFGIDYLLAPKDLDVRAEPVPAAPAPSFLQQAQQAKQFMQMQKVLEQLNGRPDGTAHLLDLLDPLNIDLSTLLLMAGDMEKSELIQVIDKDRRGNWKIEITSQGRAFLATMQS
jgi:hypothetical protein